MSLKVSFEEWIEVLELEFGCTFGGGGEDLLNGATHTESKVQVGKVHTDMTKA